MMDDDLSDKIEAVGVHLSYRFGGWYASCEAGHFGPYANQGDALAGVISQVLEQLHQLHATIEGHPLWLRQYRPGLRSRVELGWLTPR